MKITALRSFVALSLLIAFCSYVSAGPRGEKGRPSSGPGSAPASSLNSPSINSNPGSRSGPGFSNTNNPGMMGRTANEFPNSFNQNNNPGTLGSSFGKDMSLQARMRENDAARHGITNELFGRSSSLHDPKGLFGGNRQPTPAPNCWTIGIPNHGISPIPSATPHVFPSPFVWPSPFPRLSPCPSPFPRLSPWPSPFPQFSPWPPSWAQIRDFLHNLPPLPSFPPINFHHGSPFPSPSVAPTPSDS